MKEEETRTEQSLSAPPPTSASHTHTSASKSHDVLVIPGLLPLPQLPSPPTHSTPTHYWLSSLGGSGGGLYSTSTSTLPKQTGSTPRQSGPVSTVASTFHRRTGSTSRHTGPAVDSSLHRVTSNSNGAAEMAKALHCSSTPLMAVVSDCLLVCVCAHWVHLFFT